MSNNFLNYKKISNYFLNDESNILDFNSFIDDSIKKYNKIIINNTLNNMLFNCTIENYKVINFYSKKERYIEWVNKDITIEKMLSNFTQKRKGKSSFFYSISFFLS